MVRGPRAPLTALRNDVAGVVLRAHEGSDARRTAEVHVGDERGLARLQHVRCAAGDTQGCSR